MIDTIAKVALAKVTEHWESAVTILLIILYGRNDYRVTKLEKVVSPPCVSPEVCTLKQLTCEERMIAMKTELLHGADEFIKLSNKIDKITDEQKANNTHQLDMIIRILERHSNQPRMRDQDVTP